MALADLIVVMNEGRIEQAGPPRDVFERPATAFVARFMGDHNVVSGRAISVDGRDAAGSAERWPVCRQRHRSVPTGEPADIAIRTDHVRLGPSTGAGLGFTGTVSNIEYRGASVKLSVDGAGVEDFTAIVDDISFFAKPVKVGDAVPLNWDVEDAIVLGRPDKLGHL